mmetsp:Transcript_2864/g.5214  ORF Transcript_2864/g.5214 Transcript_2864/m.5214 type:complete len:105 (+) Transcript_2864:632-946(+)
MTICLALREDSYSIQMIERQICYLFIIPDPRGRSLLLHTLLIISQGDPTTMSPAFNPIHNNCTSMLFLILGIYLQITYHFNHMEGVKGKQRMQQQLHLQCKTPA